jgi:hypothetical protein
VPLSQGIQAQAFRPLIGNWFGGVCRDFELYENTGLMVGIHRLFAEHFVSVTVTASQAAILPPHRFYYLHNFQQALDWLAQRYGDLLSEQEADFIAGFARLPQNSRALLVRMLMRRGPWFRASKLAYEEIPVTVDAAAPLLERGWLSTTEPMEAVELFGLHTKPELLQILTGFELCSSMRKAEMLQLLAERQPEPRPYAVWHPEAVEPVWRVMVGELGERLRLMFFGNLYQDWSEFVLADLGIFRYEPVALDADSRAFQRREDLDFYLEISARRQALDEGVEPAQLLPALIENNSENPWLDMRRAKVLLKLGQVCERLQDWPLAAQAYTASRYAGARHRHIRVLERMQCFDQALALASQAQAAPESEEERQRVARMLPRLSRSMGLGAMGRQPALAPAVAALRSDVQLDRPAQPMAVEYALQAHWHSADAPVFYVENALVNSLFGLLCWPAILRRCRGRFFIPSRVGRPIWGHRILCCAASRCLMPVWPSWRTVATRPRFASALPTSKEFSRRLYSGAR